MWSLKCQKWFIFCIFCRWLQNISHSLGKIFTRIWKILFSSFQKMLWVFGFWAIISKTSTVDDTEFLYFIADLAVSLCFYPQYLLKGNYKGYWPYYFLKEMKKIFEVRLNLFLKLWLIFCCQKIQNICILDILMIITLITTLITRQMTPFFYLLFEFFRWYISFYAFQDLQNSVLWSPLFELCSGL